jgi:hypothetical protein
MKTVFNIIFFILILAASTAQADIVVTDIGTNEPMPLVYAMPRYLPLDLKHFLESADEFTLYSLTPGPNGGTINFGWNKILGQIKIGKNAERTNLVTALSDGIAEGAIPADCFEPRHGIRAVKNGVAMDFVICFECHPIYVYSNRGTNWCFSVSKTPAALFNQTLQKAGIPLSKY